MAILGGLAAAVFFATATLCSSRSTRMIPPASVLAWVMITGLVLLLPALAVVDVPCPDGAQVGWLLVSGVGNVVGLLLALPVIVVGVVLAATGPTTDLVAADDGSARTARPVLLACAAALSFGASLYATSKASADLPVPWVLLPARLIGVAAIAVPLALRGSLALTRPAVPLVLAAGVCEVLGFASFAAGSRHGVAVAAVLASQFAALAAVAAFVLFRERLTRLQLSGVSLLALGVATLAAISA